MRSAPLAALLILAGCARPAADTAPATTAGSPSAATAPVRTPTISPAGNPALGGVVLPLEKMIADDLAGAPVLTTLARAVDAGGLGSTLRAAGPFTVFAPTDEAFGRLQPGTVEALMKLENRASLAKLLGLHIVPERLGGVELMARITAGGGRATLPTVSGEPLTATLTGGIVTLVDSGGNKSYIEVADIRAANGVIHVVNGVLVPRLN